MEKEHFESPHAEKGGATKEKTPAERLREKLSPHLKKARTYVAAGLVLLGAHEGAKTELKYEHPGSVLWNPIVESIEDMADVLHEHFGVQEDARGPLAEMKVEGKEDLLTVSEERLLTDLGARRDQRLSSAGKYWAYQHARHLARLNDVSGVHAPLTGKDVRVDGYEDFLQSTKFINPPENVLLEKSESK